MFRLRQAFPRPRVEDRVAGVRNELATLFPEGRFRAGAEIGITVGSRGITGFAGMVREVVDFLKGRGAAPFIIPAMGSHGGATAEGQTHLIGHYGITAESMGCPVRAAMETRSLGLAPNGVDVLIAEAAWQSDGVLLMNRIKPHTDYKDTIESGLSKMCAIGLGKLDGAGEIHAHIFDVGLGEAIRTVAGKVVETGKIVGGLAILENAYHETARVVGVPVDDFFTSEEALLVEARGLTGRLPLQEVDVLVCDRMGKNVSGTGLDTNIIGRSAHGYVQGVPWCEGMPSVMRIVVSDLSDESDGNAVGMGTVDFVTERFMRKVNHTITSLNAMTACAPGEARTPVVMPNDREALVAAIRTSKRRPEGPRVVYVRDTLELVDALLSEACLPLVKDRDDMEVLSEARPLEFDGNGYLVSPFSPSPRTPSE